MTGASCWRMACTALCTASAFFSCRAACPVFNSRLQHALLSTAALLLKSRQMLLAWLAALAVGHVFSCHRVKRCTACIIPYTASLYTSDYIDFIVANPKQ